MSGELRNGMLPDYAEITAIVRACTELLDHKVLKEVEGLENPTTELLALWLVDRVSPEIDRLGGTLTALVVDEGGHECRWTRA